MTGLLFNWPTPDRCLISPVKSSPVQEQERDGWDSPSEHPRQPSQTILDEKTEEKFAENPTNLNVTVPSQVQIKIETSAAGLEPSRCLDQPELPKLVFPDAQLWDVFVNQVRLF